MTASLSLADRDDTGLTAEPLFGAAEKACLTVAPGGVARGAVTVGLDVEAMTALREWLTERIDAAGALAAPGAPHDRAAAPGDQPPPVRNVGVSAHEHAADVMLPWGASRGVGDPDANLARRVSGDLFDRAAVGLERYGTKLQAHNGRDPGWDGYQELLDAVAYAAQLHLETVPGTDREKQTHRLLWSTWGLAERWAAYADPDEATKNG